MAKTETIIQKLLTKRMAGSYTTYKTESLALVEQSAKPLFEEKNTEAINAILDLLAIGIPPFPNTEYVKLDYVDCLLGVILTITKLPKDKYPEYNNIDFLRDIVTKIMLRPGNSEVLNKNHFIIQGAIDLGILHLFQGCIIDKFGAVIYLIGKDIANNTTSLNDFQILFEASIRDGNEGVFNPQLAFLIVTLKKRAMLRTIYTALNSHIDGIVAYKKQQYGDNVDTILVLKGVYHELRRTIYSLVNFITEVEKVADKYQIAFDNSISKFKNFFIKFDAVISEPIKETRCPSEHPDDLEEDDTELKRRDALKLNKSNYRNYAPNVARVMTSRKRKTPYLKPFETRPIKSC